MLDNGTCSVVHYAEFCRETDWCVKTWRGNSSDNMTGDARVWTVSGRESHLQTDWASYCETTAFRFWDWTVTLARLILSLPMWTCAHSACQWGHCWLSPDQHSDRSKCENIKCPKCGESIMIKTFSHIPNIPQSPLHYCCLFLKFNFFSHRVGLSNSRGSKHQPEWLYHRDQVFIFVACFNNYCIHYFQEWRGHTGDILLV